MFPCLFARHPLFLAAANAAVAEAAAVTARADDFTASVEAECDVLRAANALAARKHTDPVTAAAAKLAQGLR